MSDFIYNDNLNGDGDKEPVRFYFGGGQGKHGVPVHVIVFVCIFSILISASLGILGGYLVTKNALSKQNKGDVVINDIKTSPYESIASADMYLGGIDRADVIEVIKDTVVEVRTQYVVSNSYYTQSGAGSGVIVGKFQAKNDDGAVLSNGYHIITNAHVIEDAVNSGNSKITVTLTDGTSYESTVVGSDSLSDIAVLQIETKPDLELACATFANENYEMRVGEDIIAIGNPLGQLGGTVTNGYISALDREIEVDGIRMNLLQIDAPINPGNSGGGLFNLRGELVGIVNAKSIGTEIEGLGFAIPINDASKIYRDFVTLGYVTGRPTIYAEYDMHYRGNVYVSKVHERNDGDNSNVLQIYDMIIGVRINGDDFVISSAEQLDKIIGKMPIGSELTLLVRRGNEIGYVTVTVFEYYE
ncbi:MAG: trypsin-like peptidase domain-containing protein [Clostridia bacterium]|nr:trypsin-like peptidase domain-containing protein [Clostridia bacterium]